VKHKSLFQDDNSHVNALVVRIKSSIENLNSRLETADRTIQQQKRALGKNSQAGQEAANMVSGLQAVFAEAANDFKKVLQERTENLKETENIQRQIYSNADSDMDDIPDMSRPTLSAPPVFGSDAFPALDLTSALTASIESPLPRPHGIMSSVSAAGAAGINDNNVGITGNVNNNTLRHQYSGQYSAISSGNSALLTPLDIQRMEQEQGDTQMMQLIPDQDYLQQRADAMSTVESHIVELGTIFNKLAGLVHEHREMVQRVEDNVEEANASIFQSMNALTDTLDNLRTNRALMLRVFSILVVFIIFFIIFFA
jgi:syntaxin 5